MLVEDWTVAIRRDQNHQTSEHQQAITIIQNVLQHKAKPDDAAHDIAALYEPSIRHRPQVSPVATFWSIVCDAVRALCSNAELADRVVDLLDSISELPDVLDSLGNAITPSLVSAGIYWRDLPEFGIIFRQYGIDVELLDETDDQTSRESQATAYLNATIFGATYLAHGKFPIAMASYAEVSLMQGIEVPYQTLEQQQRAGMYLPQAATWLLLAGERIYELCKSNHNYEDGAPGSTPNNDPWLWGKGRGFSLERWALWKKRFGELADAQDQSSNVRDLGAKMASWMLDIESNGD